MPTLEHSSLVDMFRGNPRLAPHLVEKLFHLEVPRHESVHVAESTLDQTLAVEMRADLVLNLNDAEGTPVLSFVVEVQRSIDPDKTYSWPAYLANLRLRTRGPVIVLVVAPDEKVSRWAWR